MNYIKKTFSICILVSTIVIFSGCDDLPWQKDRLPAFEQSHEMNMNEKEMIMDAYIAERSDEFVPNAMDLKRVFLGFEEDGIFDDMRTPDLLEGKSYEEKVALTGDFVTQMMEDINRTHVAESASTLTDDAVPIVDLATGVKKYFHQSNGQERYREYLAQRFTIGVYPTIQEMEGEWAGSVNISKVVVFKEMVGSPQHDPAIYQTVKGNHDFDFVIDMNDLSEKYVDDEKLDDEENMPQLEDPTPSVKIDQVPNGTLSPLSQKDASQFPFTYSFIPDFSQKTIEIPIYYNEIKENGLLTARFGDDMKKVEGVINVSTQKENGTPTLEGEFHINFLNRFVKMSGSFTATKQ
jgi:hypothetical protein